MKAEILGYTLGHVNSETRNLTWRLRNLQTHSLILHPWHWSPCLLTCLTLSDMKAETLDEALHNTLTKDFG